MHLITVYTLLCLCVNVCVYDIVAHFVVWLVYAHNPAFNFNSDQWVICGSCASKVTEAFVHTFTGIKCVLLIILMFF